jgi:multidrug transporter EmrE-like cation transporter
MSLPVPITEASDAAPAESIADEVRHTSVRSILLVILCTISGAAAQILLRYGADRIEGGDSILTLLTSGAALLALLGNWPVVAGYACLAVNMLLLILALRGGHLSVLYPIIALTYVWVTILAPIFFGDDLNAYKLAGVGFIVIGVSMIGFGSRR